MNVVQKNTLIAEFMGGYFYTEGDNYINFPESDTIFSLDTISLSALEFHCNYNWLFEVVDKIEKLQKYEVTITKPLNTTYHYCNINWIKAEGKYMVIAVGNGTTKIEAIYNACWQFIQWYNLNK